VRRERVVIIGAGPAGCAAAVQCSRLLCKPVLIDRTGAAGGLIENAHLIENYPGTEGPLSGPEFVRRLRRQIDSFAIPVEKSTVHGIEPAGPHFLLSGDFGEMEAESVIVATGTVPLHAGFAGEAGVAGSRLFYEVRDAVKTGPQRVVVVGGGEAAFDYSLTLDTAGAEVDLCIRAAQSHAGARLTEMVRGRERIRVHYQNVVTHVVEDESGLQVGTSGTDGDRILAVDCVVVAVGRRSAARAVLPFPALAASDNAPICLTSRPGLFIAGDARLGSLGQAGIAVGDGLQAARAAADFLETGDEAC